MSNPAEKPANSARNRGISFVASDIAGAVSEIREKLGPGAIILDIRRASSRGLGRLWRRPQVEVIACLPEAPDEGTNPGRPEAHPGVEPPPAAPAPAATVPHREALNRYARAGIAGASATTGAGAGPGPGSSPVPPPASKAALPALEDLAGMEEEEAGVRGSLWRCSAVFDRLGLLPLHAERVLARMQEIHGEDRRPPETLAQEVAIAKSALLQLWRPTPRPGSKESAPLHVFIGVPGSGKSTVLCKWLAQTLLIDNQPARVWRLDGRTTNASELVSLYGEILRVRVERTWNGRDDGAVAGFVDLAGVDFHDRESVDGLAETLARLPGATVHLVLNAAYTVPLLMAQARAFSGLPVDDMILTHLDEETSWGKLWNLVLGTTYPVSRLSAGQNIPGRFWEAQAEHLSGSLFGP